MSKELEDLLVAERGIPFVTAASYFVATKQASTGELNKEAGDRQPSPSEAARIKGLLSGIRSSTAADVTHAERVKRLRGTRVGSGVGALGGAAAGYLAGKGGGVAGKLGGSALGALIGRGIGKTLGGEADRSRVVTRYKPKKAEIEKHGSVSLVRELWKQATDAVTTPIGDLGELGGTEPGQSIGEPGVGVDRQAPPAEVRANGGPTPEQLAHANSMAQLQQDAELEEMTQGNEAEFFRQKAEEAGVAAEQLGAELQQSQAQAAQAGEQAALSQQQADAAVQQAQGIQQGMGQQLQGAQEESLALNEQSMKLRQSIQDYRKQLQDFILQDPTDGITGPTVGEPPTQPSPGEIQSMMADQQMQKEQTKVEGQPVAEQTKAGSVKQRLLGAAMGGLGGAGIQSVSDLRGKTGKSKKELILGAKVKHLEGKKNKSAVSKHQLSMAKALRDVAKTNREHPRSAAVLAALSGAGAGAILGPKAISGGRSLFKAIAARGGR